MLKKIRVNLNMLYKLKTSNIYTNKSKLIYILLHYYYKIVNFFRKLWYFLIQKINLIKF